MAEPLPAEAPYTLRDILDYLESCAQFTHAVKRRSEIVQPRYSNPPEFPPPSQFLADHYAASRLFPAPTRMNFETAIALKLFYRLERVSKKCITQNSTLQSSQGSS